MPFKRVKSPAAAPSGVAPEATADKLRKQAGAPSQAAKNQFPRQMVQAGRVQAPRHDTPKGLA